MLRFALLFAFLGVCLASPPVPHAFQVENDAALIEIVHVGNVHTGIYTETVDGYTVLQNSDEVWTYALKNNSTGDLEVSDLIVGEDAPPEDLEKHLRPDNAPVKEEDPNAPQSINLVRRAEEARRARRALRPLGTIKNLVVLFKFSDQASVNFPTRDDVNKVFNGGRDHRMSPYGSIQEFYRRSSFGKINLVSVLTQWITITQTERTCSGGDRGLNVAAQRCMLEALRLADRTVNFRDFDSDNDGVIDAITFVHSGIGAEGSSSPTFKIWSHKWAFVNPFTSGEGVKVSTYNINAARRSETIPIGPCLPAHEIGHFFGLPDLYDYSGRGSGISTWGVMGNSWGQDRGCKRTPAFSPWSRYKFGWVTPKVASTPGTYTLRPFQNFGDVIKITHNFPAKEYLLVEFRINKAEESTANSNGIIIWHIDDTRTTQLKGRTTAPQTPGASGYPENGHYYAVGVQQADKAYELERGSWSDAEDVYRSGGIGPSKGRTVWPNTAAYTGGVFKETNIHISDIKISGTTSASFKLSFSSTPPPSKTNYKIRIYVGNNNHAESSGPHYFSLWSGSTRCGAEVAVRNFERNQVFELNIPCDKLPTAVKARYGSNDGVLLNRMYVYKPDGSRLAYKYINHWLDGDSLSTQKALTLAFKQDRYLVSYKVGTINYADSTGPHYFAVYAKEGLCAEYSVTGMSKGATKSYNYYCPGVPTTLVARYGSNDGAFLESVTVRDSSKVFSMTTLNRWVDGDDSASHKVWGVTLTQLAGRTLYTISVYVSNYDYAESTGTHYLSMYSTTGFCGEVRLTGLQKDSIRTVTISCPGGTPRYLRMRAGSTDGANIRGFIVKDPSGKTLLNKFTGHWVDAQTYAKHSLWYVSFAPSRAYPITFQVANSAHAESSGPHDIAVYSANGYVCAEGRISGWQRGAKRTFYFYCPDEPRLITFRAESNDGLLIQSVGWKTQKTVNKWVDGDSGKANVYWGLSL
eukprot:m.251839 g.251839  ORF g.251839 m.251839 type:complete len:974 (-) comp26701_c0_seq1:213-3134(-)